VSYGASARGRPRSRLARGPRVSLLHQPQRARAADGQAVVCPLLRGSSPTRGVAPKQHRGARACFHSGISGWFSLSLNPRARGCRRICRGERWFRPARCYGEIAGGAVANLVLLISGPRVNLFHHPQRAREGADGQAVVCPLLRGSSPTRGVAPKQHRGLGRAFTPAFRAGSLSLNPLARGCRRICRGEIWKYGFGRRDAARPARAARI
jgi:hypothetical protein